MKRAAILILLILVLYAPLRAQIPGLYSSFGYDRHNRKLEPTQWIAGLHSNTFLKNNEYFGPYTEGITYIGTTLQPYASWAVNSKVRLVGGWYLRQFFGDDSMNASLPSLRVEYDFIPGARVVAGRLYGRLFHGYAEPVFSTDNYFKTKPEYGLQLLMDRQFFTSDLWLSWERFIQSGSTGPEIIHAGLVFRGYLQPRDKERGLVADFQSLIYHEGGQIGWRETPLITRANMVGGLQYLMKPGHSLLNRLSLSAYYIQALELSPTNLLPYNKGYGLFGSIEASNNWAMTSVSYFNGQFFFAPLGDRLFQSVSDHLPWYFQHSRNLILNKIMFQHNPFEFIHLGFRFESYYDLDDKRFDFSYGFNISLDPIFATGFLKNN